MRRSSYLLIALLVAVEGCGYWGRRSVDPQTHIRAGDTVWIWTDGRVVQWHDVVITQDSVAGIPLDMPRHCVACRRTISRSQVDSMKIVYKTGVQKIGEGAGIVAGLLLVEVAVCMVVAPLNHNSC
jgi:hypothetical protein